MASFTIVAKIHFYHVTCKYNVEKLNLSISSQSIIVLLCHLLRNTCTFNTYYFAK